MATLLWMTTLRQGIGLAGVLMLAFVLDKLEPETFLCVPNPLNGGQGYTELCRLGGLILKTLRGIWSNDEGQDIAEYAVMLAVILVIVIGTVRLIGGNANNVFSTVASEIK